MKRYMLDSNAISALISQKPLFMQHLQAAKMSGAKIGTCEPVIAELYYGLELSRTQDRNLPLLKHALSKLIVWPFEREASKLFGKLAGYLKRTGNPIQTIDIMIASIALSINDCCVITTDSDFQKIPKLEIEN